LTFDQVRTQGKFEPSTDQVPNFKITNSVFWLKIELNNQTYDPKVFLTLAYPPLDQVTLYAPSGNGYVVDGSGEQVPVSSRRFQNQNFIFNLNIPHGNTNTCYLKIRSTEQILVPISVGSYEATFNTLNTQDIFIAIYIGIILVMIFYNFFVYLTVRDRSYLYYVIYIFVVGLTQLCLQGYSYRFFWPRSPEVANQSVIWLPAITGIVAIEFFKTFIQIREYSKKFVWALNLLSAWYMINCALSIGGQHQLSQQLMQPNAMIAALVIVYMSIYAIRKGNRPAIFFLIAWVAFLAGIIVFVLKDASVLPYNVFTNSILQIGSAIEVVVLSFALADKINIFRKEKEQSQAQALLALQENERIVLEQNVMLEAKVNERTFELKVSNDELNKAMVELKEAETQLVESEKMASLGQLTAGIAHEINNPINFVTSNVKPLNRDVLILLDAIAAIEKIALDNISADQKQKLIDEYKLDIDYDYLKEEIDQLLRGIGEGASRTAEIVKGLRIFSRLDEDDLKKADINEGLDSTLVITNNLLNNIIRIEKQYSNLPMVECYPGKLNQVFLNIISNAIYAVKKKFGEAEGGLLTLSTNFDEHNIFIKISDNGTGMDENTKKRLFEPFFTTKDVGEGTGLGMSIAYNTINKHNGQIIVNSEIGVGTEFILKLPLIQK
jgi:signal transduction histidine kinase